MTGFDVQNVAKLVQDGIGKTFQDELYKRFMEQAEVIARATASEIAEHISANVTGMHSDALAQFKFDLHFKMVSPDIPSASTIVDVRDGVPLIAWGGVDTKSLRGKKIFVA